MEKPEEYIGVPRGALQFSELRLGEMDDGQLLQWAQEQVLRAMANNPDRLDQAVAHLAFGIVVGLAIRAIR